jgi:hypothetical protein
MLSSHGSVIFRVLSADHCNNYADPAYPHAELESEIKHSCRFALVGRLAGIKDRLADAAL